jgi:hypothetical protein
VVKIQRRKRHSSTGMPYDEYTVLYYLGGNRTRKNCSTFAESMALAEIKTAELSRGEIDAAQFSGSDRLAYGQALETLRPTKVDLNSAALEYAQAQEILGGHSITEACRYFMRHHSEELTPKPVNDVYAEFIQQRNKAGLSDRYLEDLRYRLGAFSKGFVCEINQITPDQVELWLDALGLSARSHNNHLRALNTFFKFAKVREYLSKDFDPLEGIMRKK